MQKSIMLSASMQAILDRETQIKMFSKWKKDAETIQVQNGQRFN
jgi:hypothetical protein